MSSYTAEELIAELEKAQAALFEVCKASVPGESTEEWHSEISAAKTRVESLWLLAQMMPVAYKTRPTVKLPDGLVPDESAGLGVNGAEEPVACGELSCVYMEPHDHGPACTKTCVVCGGH